MMLRCERCGFEIAEERFAERCAAAARFDEEVVRLIEDGECPECGMGTLEEA